MSSEIKEAVTRCQVCSEYQANNPHQLMQAHKIPDTPWGRLAGDLFTLLHRPSWLLLRLCWGKPCQSDHVYSHHQVRESAIQSTWYFGCLGNWRVGNLLSLLNSGSSNVLSYNHIAPNPKKKDQSAVKVVENLFEKALKNNKDCGWFCWTNEIRPQPAYSQALSSCWCQEGKKKTLVPKVPVSWSPRRSVRQKPQEASESRKHDSDFKVERPVLGHRDVPIEAFW